MSENPIRKTARYQSKRLERALTVFFFKYFPPGRFVRYLVKKVIERDLKG